MTWTERIEMYLALGLPVSGGKGDSTAQAAEQQQMQFSQQLMQVFQQQFGQQSAVLKFLTSTLKPQIENPQGYSPTALNAMRAQATDNISGQYQQAQRALQQKEFSQGGRDLPSGVNAQLDAGLFAKEAQDKAAAQNTISLNNENLKQANYWNAIDTLSGKVAPQFSPLGYAGSATSADAAVAPLSEANTAANQSQLLGALGGIAGGAAEGALGNPNLHL